MSGNGGMNTSATRAEALTFQSSVAGAVIPWLRGMHRVPGNLVWYGDFKATAHTQRQGGKGGGGGTSTTYSYSSSLVMIAAHGPVSDIPRVWKGKSQTTRSGLGLTLLAGAIGQATWSGLSGKGVEAIGYSGLAGVAVSAYDLGDSSSVENHSFEVQHTSAYSTVAGKPDIDPTGPVRELLIDPHRGAGMPAGLLGDWSAWSDYCVASGLLMSPLLLQQVAAHEALRTVVDLTNAAIVWSEGKVKIKPYGDTAITGNGRTYTPDTTPVYELDDTCYDSTGGKVPVVCSLKSDDDRFNYVTVQYRDRSNGYNVATVTAKDVTDISVRGVRPMDTIIADWICDAEVARLVAEIKKQRSLGVVAEYKVHLPWHYALVECMDLLTLTDSTLQMLDVPVRVVEITEESDDELTLVCEDYPPGMASAPRYPAQVPVGFATDALAAAPSVSDAVLFEAPAMLAAGNYGLEVWCAVRSPGSNWGGATVWVSLDGTTYRAISRVEGGARIGALAGAISGGNLPVTGMSGQLISGSAADAATLTTLCAILGAQPEYLAYQTASLTGAGAYTLSGLVRGAYGTAPTAHAAGDRFIRIDEAIAKSGALDISYAGKRIWFKFTSFNWYGAAEQSLAEVSPISYDVTGVFAKAPPDNVVFGTAEMRPGYARITYTTCPDTDYDRTLLRVGATWAAATPLPGQGDRSGYNWQWPSLGTYKVWAVHVDKWGYTSTPQSTTVTVTAAILVGADLINAPPGWLNSYASLGQNLLANSEQTTCTWGIEYNPNGAVVGFGPMLSSLASGWSTGDWVLAGGATKGCTVRQLGSVSGGSAAVAFDLYPLGSKDASSVACVPGDRMCASVYLQTQHCSAEVFLRFYGVDGANISNPSSGTVTDSGYANTLAAHTRAAAISVVPAGAATVALMVRKYNTSSGSDSYVWLAAPQIERVNTDQSGPSPYQPGPPTSTRQIGYQGDLDATKNLRYYQESDPGAVAENSLWITSKRSWERIGGVWRPYVGPESVDTAELAPNSATVVIQDSVDFAGTGVAQIVQAWRTINYTPPVACTINFSASIVASGVNPDAGNGLYWTVSQGGGADTGLASCNSNSSVRQMFTGITSFTAAAGVPLVFKLVSDRASGNPSLNLYASSIRIEAIKR